MNIRLAIWCAVLCFFLLCTSGGVKAQKSLAISSGKIFVTSLGKILMTGSRTTQNPVISDFSCGNTLTVTHTTANGVTPAAVASVTIGYSTVISSLTGSPKCWITQNLGASRTAGTATDTSDESAGWYWQFNCKKGYKAGSVVGWNPSISELSDWGAANDPCTLELGANWRIPTDEEWSNADANTANPWVNYSGAFNSGLRLHTSGMLNMADGELSDLGTLGKYWSNRKSSEEEGYLLSIESDFSNLTSDNLANGCSIRCINDIILPTVSASIISNLTDSSVNFSATLGSMGTPAVTAYGFVIGDDTKPNPTTTDNIRIVAGTLTSLTLTGIVSDLTASKQYYVKAYATSTAVTAYGAQVGFLTATPPFACGDTLTINHNTANGVAPVSGTINYGTASTALWGGRQCWITQNLGASCTAATATDTSDESAGWFWQFSRKKGYVGVLNTAIQGWITTDPTTKGNWSIDSDPCSLELGAGWHIPTSYEWTYARAGIGWTNINLAFASILKLHAAGFLDSKNGALGNCGVFCNYWSRTSTSSNYATALSSHSTGYSIYQTYMEPGFSLRCIKDVSSFVCGDTLTISHISGVDRVAPETVTIKYKTVNTSIAGSGERCWIAQNLGARSQASSPTDTSPDATGWYWQYNRKKGYVGVLNTAIPNWNSYNSATGSWIEANDPCFLELGAGWRLPSYNEWSSVAANSTFASVLKPHTAGYLTYTNGALTKLGVYGYYWSYTADNPYRSYKLNFNGSVSKVDYYENIYGLPIRCLTPFFVIFQ